MKTNVAVWLLNFAIFTQTYAVNHLQSSLTKHNRRYLKNVAIGTCVGYISRVYFIRKERIPIIVATNTMDDKVPIRENPELQGTVNQLVSHMGSYSAIAIIHSNPFVSKYTVENFVVITEDAASLKYKIFLLPAEYFSYAGRIIFVIKTEFEIESQIKKVVQDILNICWSLHMVNVVAVIYLQGYPRVFSYHPYLPGDCGQSKMIELGVCVNNSLVNNTYLYPPKSLNMNGCQVRVTAVPRETYVTILNKPNGQLALEGIEGNLITTLSNLLNFSLVVILASDKERWGFQTGSTWSGVMGDLISNRTDVGLGVFLPSVEIVKFVEMSDVYLTVDLVWVLPRFEKTSSIAKVFQPFSNVIWYLSIVTVFSLLFMFIILKCIILNKTVKVKGLGMAVWGATLGMPIEFETVGRFACYILAFWMWIAMVLRNSYQGSLVSFLTRIDYDDKVTTMRDMLDMGLCFSGTSKTVEILSNVDEEIVDEIRQKFNVLGSNEEFEALVERIAFEQDRSTVLHLRDWVARFNRKNLLKGKLNVLKQTYGSQIITMAIQKSSPLGEAFDKWIYRITEAGLIEKWANEFYLLQSASENEPIVLQIRHLTGAFIVLFLGAIMSSVMFIAEVVHYKHYVLTPMTGERRLSNAGFFF